MVANLLMSASMTMIMPFLSLYIETFGNYSDSYVQRWAGYIFGVTFLVAFIFSPIWGRIGDKHGYKGILILTSFGYLFVDFADFYGSCYRIYWC